VTVWRHLLSRVGVFGCVERTDLNYLVLGIPLDQSTTHKPGTRFAPTRIREAACNIELYSLYSELSLEDIGFNDLGDVVMPPGDLSKALENVEQVSRGVIEEYPNSLLIILGGEHTITYPIIKALKKRVDTLVVFDAHLDLRDEYLGSKINHATVMRRIFEDLHIPLVYVGSRAYSREEVQFLHTVKSDEISVCSAPMVMRGMCNFKDLGKVYLSIDVDVVDPSYAPGVSNPEPLGITPHDLVKVLYSILDEAEGVVGLDLVEVNPLVDVNDITSILASKIVFELIGFLRKAEERA